MSLTWRQCPPPPSEVSVNDVIEHFGQVVTLAPGHPLRSTRCLKCASMIGGRSCRTYTINDFRHAACLCGAIACATFLICAEHDMAESEQLLTLALDRHPAGKPKAI